jgi:hypothetical protein
MKYYFSCLVEVLLRTLLPYRRDIGAIFARFWKSRNSGSDYERLK